MLRVIDRTTYTHVAVTVDEYVPLELNFWQSERMDKLYWRAKASDTSLLEVAIAPDSGALLSVTLTAISPSRVRRVRSAPAASSREGIPIVDLEKWPVREQSFADRFIDEEVELKFAISETHAVVRIGAERTGGEFWSAGNVRFGLDDSGFLCAIEVGGLSPRQLALLVELAAG